MAETAPSDLDRSIPVMVRRSEPAPAGPPAQLVRSFMLLTAAGLAAGALLLIGTLSAKQGVSAVALVYGLLAVCAALLSRLPAPWLVRALAGLLAATTVTVGVAAVTLGWGLGSPALSLLPLIVCVMGATGGWRMALLLAAVSAAVVLGVAWAVPSMGALQGPPSTVLRLGAQLLAIAVGLAGGIVLARLVTRALQSTQTREQRFRRLLWLAADAYWEIDGDYKLVAAGQHEHELRVLSEQTGLGGVPWELPRFACDPETLDVLLADLGTRTPFRDLPFTWRNRDGSVRSYLASGEPRFDSRGVF